MKALSAYEPMLFNDRYRFVVMRGGTGSGKSYHTRLRILSRIVNESPHIYLCLRKTGRMVRNSIFKGFKDTITQMGLYEQFDFNLTNYEITYKPNGNAIWCSGVDDPDKLRSIEGVTSVWMEEADEFTADDFLELNRRFRASTPHHKEILITFNPTSKESWIYREFFELGHRADDTLYLHTTYQDNPFLDPEVVKEINRYKEVNPYHYQVYALGEWGILSGQIYPMWQTCTAMPENPKEVFYGMDFGYNVPTALIKVAMHDGLYYLQECIYEEGLTMPDIIARMKELGIKRTNPIFCDAAEPDRITELVRADFNAHKAIKDVDAGINYVRGLYDKIYSLHDNVNLHAETHSYQWKKANDGRILDEPVKIKDHILDALRYAMYTHKMNNRTISFTFAK